MKQPTFWYRYSLLSYLLYPLGLIYDMIGKMRQAWVKPLRLEKDKVICVGNVSVGGNGKTPVALEIATLVQEQLGKKVVFLNHGYKSQVQNVFVEPKKNYTLPDEAYILANYAPTVVAKDRRQGALIAQNVPHDCLIMDDGLQNPSLHKDFNIVVVDGKMGFGNKMVMPAGPLREELNAALKKAQLVVCVGYDYWGVKKYVHENISNLVCFDGQFVPSQDDLEILQDKKICAFAGIAHNQKFFDMLRNLRLNVAHTVEFPDHYAYTHFDLEQLIRQTHDMVLVTTEKDAVKIPKKYHRHIVVVKGKFVFKHPDQVVRYLKEALWAD